jgi:putative hydrolase of the HAD superfamily
MVDESSPPGHMRPGEPLIDRTRVEVVGLDADDTLWHSEVHFVDVEDRLRALVARYAPDADTAARLIDVERRNLAVLGYGVKAFTLSMIETAIELTDAAVPATDIHEIVGWAKEMMAHPVELLPGVGAAVRQLTTSYRVVIVTKGDLFHQEAKIAESGLSELVHGVEIVSEKDEATYQRVVARFGIGADRFLMAGNSVKSDVLPVLAIGGQAVHIPYHLTWAHELVEAPPSAYPTLDRLADLPGYLGAGE